MKVTLRKQKLDSGRESLYLDIYVDQNNQYQRRLKLYLDPIRTPDDRERNKEVMRIAEKLRNKAEYELLHNKYGEKDPRDAFSHNFINFFDMLTDQRFESGVNYETWYSVQKHLHKYTDYHLKFSELNETWLEGFKSYLLANVSQNTAQQYFNLFKGSVHQAFRDKLLTADPAFNVKSPKQIDPQREYLTLEEIQKIKEVDCKFPMVKRAFLFSILTGLRWSDIINLRWKNIVAVEGNTCLDFTSQKTRDAQFLPLNKEARCFVVDPQGDEDKVFPSLKYSAHMNDAIRFWMLEAGIKKHITFHCARHTHATLLLNNGVEIYTVSKLLGHKDLKTTQIYAKLVNKSKVEAVNKLPSIIGV